MLKPAPNSPWLKVYTLAAGKYPKIWNKGIIQKALIAWADHKCECCGATDDDVLLHVHHMTWLAKKDCRWENLLVCCTGCHVRLHNQRWQPGKFWYEKHGPVPHWAVIRGHLTESGGVPDVA